MIYCVKYARDNSVIQFASGSDGPGRSPYVHMRIVRVDPRDNSGWYRVRFTGVKTAKDAQAIANQANDCWEAFELLQGVSHAP